MAKLWCCRRFQPAEVFKISPTKANVFEEFVLYLPSCSCCSRPVVEIIRADVNLNIFSPIRINSKNIPNFLKKMEILWQPAKASRFVVRNKISKFVLNYNEFGKIKACNQNISNLNLGKIETHPILNLLIYKQHKKTFMEKSFD